MIRGQVLRGLARVVQVVRPVVMMVVSLFLPMQGCMVKVGKHVHRRAYARQRHRLPEHGKKHDDEDGCALHGLASVPTQGMAGGGAGLANAPSAWHLAA